MTEEEWDELRMNTLREWLSKKHPSVLGVWEESFAELVDLDDWLEEYQGAVDQEFQAYLEGENNQ